MDTGMVQRKLALPHKFPPPSETWSNCEKKNPFSSTNSRFLISFGTQRNRSGMFTDFGI